VMYLRKNPWWRLSRGHSMPLGVWTLSSRPLVSRFVTSTASYYRGDQGLLKTTLLLSASPSCPSSLGITLCHAHGSYPSDRIKRLYDINVHGAFFTAREAAKCMIPQGGGSIILVASMSANVCLPSHCSHLHHETCTSRSSTYRR
jgi:hypothetical protein